MLKAILAFTVFFSISSRAQSEGDLYQLLHEIEDGLDQITLTPSQIQEANNHLLAARAAVYRSGTPSATLTISDGPTYNFGMTALGASEDHTFLLTNPGARTAYRISGGGLTDPFQFKGGSFPGTGGTCGNSLQPAGSCTIVVTYRPTAIGAQSDTLEVPYHDGLAMQSSSRRLTGTSVPPAVISISDGPSFDFGSVRINGSYSDKIFLLTNSGSFTASIMRGFSDGPFNFPGGYPGYNGTCGRSLAPGGTCTIIVRFTPTSLSPYYSSMAIDYFDGALQLSATRNLVGTGIR